MKRVFAIFWARVLVVLFQLRSLLRLRHRVFWQEEIWRESTTPKDKPKIVYVGVCSIPKDARWPFDPKIRRVQFYNKPLERPVTDEHATQHF